MHSRRRWSRSRESCLKKYLNGIVWDLTGEAWAGGLADDCVGSGVDDIINGPDGVGSVSAAVEDQGVGLF